MYFVEFEIEDSFAWMFSRTGMFATTANLYFKIYSAK